MPSSLRASIPLAIALRLSAWICPLRHTHCSRIVWYICAMILKQHVLMPALLAILLVPLPGSGQTVGAGANAAPQSTASPAAKPDCLTTPCDYQPPHITVTDPPAVPALWPLHDRISWAATLVLVFLGYAGIMVAVSTLKKIERQTHYAETAAEAASASAQAALLHAQAIVNAERPWVLITVEPTINVQNSSSIVAMNRGRSPAKFVAVAEQTAIAVDETHLHETPQFESEQLKAPPVPVILLPGESTVIKVFSREDARGVCDSNETFKRVENWDAKIYIYGKIIYRDLIAPENEQMHETAWCCWYIHGRQKSGLVVAGTPAYNLHT